MNAEYKRRRAPASQTWTVSLYNTRKADINVDKIDLWIWPNPNKSQCCAVFMERSMTWVLPCFVDNRTSGGDHACCLLHCWKSCFKGSILHLLDGTMAWKLQSIKFCCVSYWFLLVKTFQKYVNTRKRVCCRRAIEPGQSVRHAVAMVTSLAPDTIAVILPNLLLHSIFSLFEIKMHPRR